MLDDPDDNGWYGQAQAADATFVHEVGELERDDSQESWQDDPDTDRWHVPARAAELSSAPEADDLPRDDAYDDVWDEPRENRWDGLYAPRNGRNGTPRIGEWNFTVSRPQPWYRNKRVKTGLIAAAAVAIAVPLVLLVVRSLATGAEESTMVPSKSAHQCPACPDQRCAGAVHGETVATGTAATAAASAGSQPRAGDSSAVLPAASSECARSIGQAGDRRDPHARHPGTDQCQTTPTATAPTQLQHPRRRRRGRLGLVTSRPRTSSHVGGVN